MNQKGFKEREHRYHDFKSSKRYDFWQSNVLSFRIECLNDTWPQSSSNFYTFWALQRKEENVFALLFLAMLFSSPFARPKCCLVPWHSFWEATFVLQHVPAWIRISAYLWCLHFVSGGKWEHSEYSWVWYSESNEDGSLYGPPQAWHSDRLSLLRYLTRYLTLVSSRARWCHGLLASRTIISSSSTWIDSITCWTTILKKGLKYNQLSFFSITKSFRVAATSFRRGSKGKRKLT